MIGVRRMLRAHRMQILAIGLVTFVVTLCAVLVPVYDRAIQQAQADELLGAAPVSATGISVDSQLYDDVELHTTEEQFARLPDRVRQRFDDPVSELRVNVSTPYEKGAADELPRHGALRSREGQCDHVTLDDGQCPAAADEIAISSADAKAFGWAVGDRLSSCEDTAEGERSPCRELAVVGIYRTDAEERFWFDRPPTGHAGFPEFATTGNLVVAILHDDWLTVPETLTSAPRWLHPHRVSDLALRSDADVDDLLGLRDPVQRFVNAPIQDDRIEYGAITATVDTDLIRLSDRAYDARGDVHVLVPLFTIQLCLLAAFALLLVLSAAVESRRAHAAVIRLRGGGQDAARRLLLAGVLPGVVGGWAAGVATAVLAGPPVARRWMGASVPLELRWPTVVTALGVLLFGVVLAFAVSWAAVRVGPAALLRGVPARVRRLQGGVLGLAAACGAVFVAFAAGTVTGWPAMAATTLLALAVGLLLGQLLRPVSGALGRRIFAPGSPVAAVALLQSSRRPATQRMVAAVVVAASLVVFAVNAYASSEHDRTGLAEIEVGAPYVLRMGDAPIERVREAVAEADPSGEHATSVLELRSAGPGITTRAVVPDEFARIATFGGAAADARPALAALADRDVAPIRVAGSVELRAVGRSSAPVTVQVSLLDARAGRISRDVISIPGRRADATAQLRACRRGCLVTGVQVISDGSEATGRVSLDLRDGDGAVPLGSDRWRDASDQPTSATATGSSDRLDVDFEVDAGTVARLEHAAEPAALPALVAGPLPDTAEGSAFDAPGLSGQRAMEKVGTLPYVPGAPANTALVDLDVLLRDGGGERTASTEVWVDGAAARDRVLSALDDRHLLVIEEVSTEEQRRELARSAVAWSVQLGAMVGGGALLIAALLLFVATSSSTRERRRDLGALRRNGMTARAVRRVAVLEQVPTVMLAALLGAGCGVVGSHFSMPTLPVFPRPPELPVEQVAISWGPVAAASAVAVLGLGLVAWWCGRTVAREEGRRR